MTILDTFGICQLSYLSSYDMKNQIESPVVSLLIVLLEFIGAFNDR
jgi:hypothetical protein